MIHEMPPQVNAIYEAMVKPRLREMVPEQLTALRDFMANEIDALIAEKETDAGPPEEIH